MLRKSLLIAVSLGLSGTSFAANVSKEDVIVQYADMALAKYSDSLITATQLQGKISELLKTPSDKTLMAAKQAWIDARVPYQQSEVYRFGNELVDEWEGKVNAWPLDEGLIDYVDNTSYGEESDDNPFFTANVIANSRLTLSNNAIDASNITKALLTESLHEVDDVEANVATGYHAIEFLLWGQDLNGTNPGAGNRPVTDFDTQNCSNGHCERRAAYLTSVTSLLIDDLKDMVAMWEKDGPARTSLTQGNPDDGLNTIITGMGSLSYGELAGERMKLGLMLHDPEEEHDCFSDNTHNSHYYDALGIRNAYTGEYKRIDGSVVSGPSLADLVKAKDPATHTALLAALDLTQNKMQVLVEAANNGQSYDQLIGENNDDGNKMVQAAIDALTTQTKHIEKAASTLKVSGITIEGSDSLDAPETIQ